MAVLLHRELSTLWRIVVLHIILTMSCSHGEHLGLPNQPIALACYTHVAFLLTKNLSMDEHQSQGWPNELHSGSKRARPYCYNWIVQSVTDELLLPELFLLLPGPITLDRLIVIKCHILQCFSIPRDNVVTHTIKIIQIHFVWDHLSVSSDRRYKVRVFWGAASKTGRFCLCFFFIHVDVMYISFI